MERRSILREAMTTFAPSCTSSSAMERPMPVPPPVTIATLPSSKPSRKMVRCPCALTKSMLA